MSWAAVVGGGVSLAGGLLGKPKTGGAELQPFQTQGLESGNAAVNPDTGTIDLNVTGASADIQDKLLRVAQGNLDGGKNRNFLDLINNLSRSQIPGLFGEQQNNLSNVLSPQAALNAAGQFGALGDASALFGLQGLSGAFDGQNTDALSAEVAQRGFGALDSGSFNDLAAQRLTSLRDQARPAEENAVNRKFNSLFNQGRLGTTGGQEGLGRLAEAQNQADLGRQINSLDFAQNQRNQENQFGSNLLGQAFAGFGNQNNLNLNRGNFGANLFSGASQNFAGQLGAFGTFDQSTLSAGQNRLANAQNLFGFGQNAQSANFDQMLKALGASQSIDSGVLDQAKLAASVGQAQGQGGFNAGQLAGPNPFGTALAGLGNSISNSGGFDFGGLFGGGKGNAEVVAPPANPFRF